MAMSKEEAARRKKERRDRREQRALDAGLNKTEARALRDRSDKRVDQEIRDFILKNKSLISFNSLSFFSGERFL